MDKRRLLLNYLIWSIVPVGSSHSDSVALPTLKDKEEKLMKLETLAFFHESMD